MHGTNTTATVLSYLLKVCKHNYLCATIVQEILIDDTSNLRFSLILIMDSGRKGREGPVA